MSTVDVLPVYSIISKSLSTLYHIHSGIASAESHQFLVSSALLHHTVLDHQDLVGVPDGRKSVSYGNDSPGACDTGDFLRIALAIATLCF